VGGPKAQKEGGILDEKKKILWGGGKAASVKVRKISAKSVIQRKGWLVGNRALVVSNGKGEKKANGAQGGSKKTGSISPGGESC